jgi:hypothetical protein
LHNYIMQNKKKEILWNRGRTTWLQKEKTKKLQLMS